MDKIKARGLDITSFTLHLLAMGFMLLDHMWATIVPGNSWMTCVGRMAFPIFAFMIVEGYYHTSNFGRYVRRLLICAVLSEVPFDMMYGGTWFYPFHQNVIWTFLIALLAIYLIEKIKEKGKWVITVPAGAVIMAIAAIVGSFTFVDYYSYGVLTVFVFYLFRGHKWYHYVGQLLGLYLVHGVLFTGQYYIIPLFGYDFELQQQALAIGSLVFIWLYRGRQGLHNRFVQYGFYLFYPVHMLILGLIQYVR